MHCYLSKGEQRPAAVCGSRNRGPQRKLRADASAPLTHDNRSGSDLWNLLLYVARAFDQTLQQPMARHRHRTRIHGMILVHLVETFAGRVPPFGMSARSQSSRFAPTKKPPIF